MYYLMDADPKTSVVFTDRKAFCRYYKSASARRLKMPKDKYPFFNPTKEYVQDYYSDSGLGKEEEKKLRLVNYSENKCDKLYKNIANSFCFSPDMFKPDVKDVDRAINEVGSKSNNPADKVIYASLGCSIASKNLSVNPNRDLDNKVLNNQSAFYNDSNNGKEQYDLSLNEYVKNRENDNFSCEDHAAIASIEGVISRDSLEVNQETGIVMHNKEKYETNYVLSATQATSLGMSDKAYVEKIGYTPTIVPQNFNSVASNNVPVESTSDSLVDSQAQDSLKEDPNVINQFKNTSGLNRAITSSEIQKAIVEDKNLSDRYVGAVKTSGKDAVDNYISNGIEPLGQEGASLVENNKIKNDLEQLRADIAQKSSELNNLDEKNNQEQIADAEKEVSKLEKTIAKLERTKPTPVEHSSNRSPASTPSFKSISSRNQALRKFEGEETRIYKGDANVILPPVANMPDLSLKQVASGSYNFTFNESQLFLTSSIGGISYPIGLSNLEFNQGQDQIKSVVIRGEKIPYESLTDEQRKALDAFVSSRTTLSKELDSQYKRQQKLIQKGKEIEQAKVRYAELIEKLNANL